MLGIHIRDLVIAAFAIAIAIGWVLLSFRTQLSLIAVASILQLYIPHIPLVNGCMLLVALTALQRLRVLSRPASLAGAFFALAAWSLIATTWSPHASDARSDVVYFALLGLLVSLGLTAARAGERPDSWLGAWTTTAALQSLLVIAQRLSPGLKAAFLHGHLTQLFIDPPALTTLYTTDPNNVLDPTRAGGFLLNSNAASVVCGVAAVLAMYLALSTRQRRWLWLAGIHVVAVWETGSATGRLLLLVVACAAAALRFRRPAVRTFVPLALVVGDLVVLLRAQQSVNPLNPLGDRSFLWSQAISAVAHSPWLGLGYGGWTSRMSRYFPLLGSGTYPPHNLILLAWTNAGVVEAGLVLLIFWLAWDTATQSAAETLGIAVALCVLWSLVHALGDNISIFGDLHTAPVLCLLLGALVARTSIASQPPKAPTHALTSAVAAKKHIPAGGRVGR